MVLAGVTEKFFAWVIGERSIACSSGSFVFAHQSPPPPPLFLSEQSLLNRPFQFPDVTAFSCQPRHAALLFFTPLSPPTTLTLLFFTTYVVPGSESGGSFGAGE